MNLVTCFGKPEIIIHQAEILRYGEQLCTFRRSIIFSTCFIHWLAIN